MQPRVVSLVYSGGSALAPSVSLIPSPHPGRPHLQLRCLSYTQALHTLPADWCVRSRTNKSGSVPGPGVMESCLSQSRPDRSMNSTRAAAGWEFREQASSPEGPTRIEYRWAQVLQRIPRGQRSVGRATVPQRRRSLNIPKQLRRRYTASCSGQRPIATLKSA